MIVKEDFIYTPDGTPRTLHIYLPEGYEYSSEKYPVMYFFDGHNLFYNHDATYGKSWGMKTFLDQWKKPMIVVGIECTHKGQERLSEYLHYPAIRKPFKQFKPLGDATFAWIVNEIKPYIDNKYRTIPFRECTGIGGSSMGGLMALYGVLHYNQWFSKAACISSSINICMPHIRQAMKTLHLFPDTRVYMSWGTREVHDLEDPNKLDTTSMMYSYHQELKAYFENQDASIRLFNHVGGGHCEADWEKLVPSFYYYLWAPED